MSVDVSIPSLEAKVEALRLPGRLHDAYDLQRQRVLAQVVSGLEDHVHLRVAQPELGQAEIWRREIDISPREVDVR